MLEAGIWGLFAASSLVIGALLSFTGWIKPRPLRLVTAFGSGVLISAIAYDLVEEAVNVSATGISVAVGFVLGSLVFYAADALTDRWASSGSSQGLGILLGAVLDGIPESVVLGASLLAGGGVSVAVLVAIFISNVPEGLASSSGLAKGGRTRTSIVLIWAAVVVVSGIAAAIGYGVLRGASGDAVAVIDAFAAGAILTMLADEMIPSAFVAGDKLPGVATAAGFAFAALLSFSA